MTACTQILRETTAEGVTELWGTALTNPQFKLKHSIEFFQKLSVIMISTITYEYNIFPEDVYKSSSLLGIPIKMIKPHIEHPLVQKMKGLIGSALDALSKAYLHKMIFVIKDLETCRKEVFTLRYTYDSKVDCMFENTNGVKQTLSQKDLSPESIRSYTERMLRTLMLIPKLEKDVSKKIEMHFRLVLKEETPTSYKIKNFYSCKEKFGIDFGNIENKILCGRVFTKFHYMSTSYHIEDKMEGNKENTENLLLQDLSMNVMQNDKFEDLSEVKNTETKKRPKRMLRKVAGSVSKRQKRRH